MAQPVGCSNRILFDTISRTMLSESMKLKPRVFCKQSTSGIACGGALGAVESFDSDPIAFISALVKVGIVFSHVVEERKFWRCAITLKYTFGSFNSSQKGSSRRLLVPSRSR